MDQLLEIEMSYDGLVAAGREARVQADNMQWMEGDLALQVEALSPDERPRDPQTGEFVTDEIRALQRYAEDVDISYRMIRDYRRVAAAWPQDTRARNVGWQVHQILGAQEDRFALVRPGMSVREAKKIVRDRTKGNAGKPGWHELLGRVGEDLKAAAKHLNKVDAELKAAAKRKHPKHPNQKFIDKAAEYAEWADGLADRLRALGE